jgi:hypothetical protein
MPRGNRTLVMRPRCTRRAHSPAVFHILIDGPLAPLPDDAELDATLDAVATAMNPLDSAAGARGAP